MGPYLERSAYQVMCGMTGRDSAQPEDHFYAMVGALSAPALDDPTLAAAHPAEYFMQVCEAKGDFSFLYSTGLRGVEAGKRWRPAVADRFEAVFPWTTHGEGQPGVVHPTHIELKGMWRVPPGAITPAAARFIEHWLERGDTGSSSETIPSRILRRLRQAGFTGCGKHMEVEGGFFFPHSSRTRSDEVFVAVATGLQMPHGAPGLLLRQNRSSIHDYCSVGIFVGQVPKGREALNVG